MSRALELLGRFAAGRPWFVIGSWAAVCLVVVTSSAAFGRQLNDPFEAPGLDSQRATDLLASAGSTAMGLDADIVLTPRDPEESFFDSPGARAELATSRTTSPRCPRSLAPAILRALCKQVESPRSSPELSLPTARSH